MKYLFLTTAAAALTASFALAQTTESPAVVPDAETSTETAPEVAQSATPAAPAADGAGLYGVFADMAVRDLVGLNVLVGTGDDVGEIERLVTISGGDVQAVVGVGGFLGIGEHKVAIPLVDFTATEDAVMLPDLTEEDLEAMAEFEGEADELPLNVTVAGDPVIEAEPVLPGTDAVDGGTTEQSN